MDPIVAKILFGVGVMATGAVAWGLLKLHGRTVVNGRFKVVPDPAPLRGNVRFQIQVQPRNSMRVNRVLARTVCLRRLVECHGGWGDQRGSDYGIIGTLFFSSGRHHHHVEHDEIGRSEVEICGAEEWDAGQQRAWDVEVPLADGLPTDTEGELTVRWVAEVHFDIPSFPDVTLSAPFRVQRIYGR